MKLSNIDTLVFDLNGTLYEKGNPVRGAIETIKTLRKNGYILNFVTNTDGRRISSVLEDVRRMGFDIKKEELITPISAAKKFIKGKASKSFYFLLNDDVKLDFIDVDVDEKNPDFVVIGDFRDNLNYDEINKIFRFFMNGAKIVSLSNTLSYIGENGLNINTGAFVKMFEIACNKEAILLGKPSSDFLRTAIYRTNSLTENTIVIGDDLKTDVLGAKSIGATSVQVKTGVFNQDELNRSLIKPDYVIENVNNLLSLLEIQD